MRRGCPLWWCSWCWVTCPVLWLHMSCTQCTKKRRLGVGPLMSVAINTWPGHFPTRNTGPRTCNCGPCPQPGSGTSTNQQSQGQTGRDWPLGSGNGTNGCRIAGVLPTRQRWGRATVPPLRAADRPQRWGGERWLKRRRARRPPWPYRLTGPRGHLSWWGQDHAYMIR